MTIVAAVHQPNFFPWLGYFDKIARCDHFVFLDHVQFPKTGGIWSNRVRLLVSGRPEWVTAPVDRAYHGTRAINAIEFSDRQPWRAKLVKTLATNYGRAPHYDETMSCLVSLIENNESNLARYNAHAITKLASHVGIKNPVWHWSSALNVEGHATDLLIAITKRVGAGVYLCGGGAGEYQQDVAFAEAGIRLDYQDYRHPQYAQRHQDAFVPGLSIIDALMECGRERVRQMLQPLTN